MTKTPAAPLRWRLRAVPPPSIVEDVLNGAASFGNAVLNNPAAVLGLVGGTLLAGVSAVGVTAGGAVSATGVGLAGASGALLAQAAQGPDAVDLFASGPGDLDRYDVWEGLPGAHPAPGDIAVSPGGRAHPFGEQDGGGHWCESGAQHLLGRGEACGAAELVYDMAFHTSAGVLVVPS